MGPICTCNSFAKCVLSMLIFESYRARSSGVRELKYWEAGKKVPQGIKRGLKMKPVNHGRGVLQLRSLRTILTTLQGARFLLLGPSTQSVLVAAVGRDQWPFAVVTVFSFTRLAQCWFQSPSPHEQKRWQG